MDDDLATDVQTCITNADERGLFWIFAAMVAGLVAFVCTQFSL